MKTKHQVHNLMILDESGSMESIKNNIIQGFNEIVQTIKGIEKEFPEQEHFISLITFNGLAVQLIHFIDPVSKLEQIDGSKYKPNAATPLFDAMGLGLSKMKQYLEGKTDYNVLVTVLTDGEENASKEYSGADIKKMIEQLKMENWAFTYIGADHDVEKIAMSISITNTMTFTKDAENMNMVFEKEKSARRNFSAKIRRKEDTDKGFYEENES